jgi:hypothetical protein
MSFMMSVNHERSWDSAKVLVFRLLTERRQSRKDDRKASERL